MERSRQQQAKAKLKVTYCDVIRKLVDSQAKFIERQDTRP
jgi:hypothetical protein